MFLAISPTVKVNRNHVVEVHLLTSTEQVDNVHKFRYLHKDWEYVFTSTSTSILVLLMTDGTIHAVKDTETAEMIYECL